MPPRYFISRNPRTQLEWESRVSLVPRPHVIKIMTHKKSDTMVNPMVSPTQVEYKVMSLVPLG